MAVKGAREINRPAPSGKKVTLTSPLLTVAEAAKVLGVSRSKIYQLIEWGELKAVKLGRSTQVEKESLDRFIAEVKLT